MKSNFTRKAAGVAAIFAIGMAGSAFAQDNPLLQPAEANPLLQQNTPTESPFEARSRAIDLAATKDSSDPVCQNIRANYDQQLAEIMAKYETADAGSLSQLNQGNRTGQDTLYRANRINRNLGGSSSGVLGEASGSAYKGVSVANDASAIGGMLGIGGKKSKQKKAAKKAAKLDAQAMDAVEQTSCPMSTFS